jgi:hypothetical protein
VKTFDDAETHASVKELELGWVSACDAPGGLTIDGHVDISWAREDLAWPFSLVGYVISLVESSLTPRATIRSAPSGRRRPRPPAAGSRTDRSNDLRTSPPCGSLVGAACRA